MLLNFRIPRTPPEIKRGFPAKEAPRPATETGKPRYADDYERGARDAGDQHVFPEIRAENYVRNAMENYIYPENYIHPGIQMIVRGEGIRALMLTSRRFLVDANGHLIAKYRKPGRAAFPMCEEVGGASWAFKKMGYV